MSIIQSNMVVEYKFRSDKKRRKQFIEDRSILCSLLHWLKIWLKIC